LATGFLAWGIGEIMFDYYGPSVEARRNRFAFDVLNREQGIADQKNAAIAFGTFGALLGLLVGAAGGALRRSVPAASSAAVAGLLLGGVGAALASYVLVPIFAHYYSDEQPSLLLPILVRGGIWAVAGLTAGLALGWGWHGRRGIPGAVIGGLIGSILATISFEVANGLIFPADRNDAVIPSSMLTRLLAYLFVAVGVALGALLLGGDRSRLAVGAASAQAEPITPREGSDRGRG
jgi:hypothetical protein